MSLSLREKTSKSFFWVAIDIIGEKILQFFIGIFLARLLLPEEFGILGLITVFIAFSMVFIDSGFSFALIREKYVSETDFNTVFWFNFLFSLFFYILLWIASPYIAIFFKQPLLIIIIKVISLNLVINAIGSIQQVNLKRELQFKQLTIAGVSSKVLSGIIALIMAFKGFGVWSLVVQQVSMNFFRVGFMFFFNKFIPKLVFSKSTFKRLFSFSSKLLYGGIINSIVSNIYPLVIGKFFTIGDVGFFNRARSLQQLPVNTITKIIQQVSLPAFSKIQDEESRFKIAYKKSMQLSVFIIAPILIILIVAAYPLIEFLITDKWLRAADMLRILAIGGIFYPISALNINIIGVKGRSDLVMYSQFIKDGLSLIAVFIGMIWGILGLVWSFALVGVLSYFINAFFANKVIDYTIKDQVLDVLPIVLIMATSGITAYFSMDLVHTNFQKILIVTIVSFLIFILLSLIFKIESLKEACVMSKLVLKRK